MRGAALRGDEEESALDGGGSDVVVNFERTSDGAAILARAERKGKEKLGGRRGDRLEKESDARGITVNEMRRNKEEGFGGNEKAGGEVVKLKVAKNLV